MLIAMSYPFTELVIENGADRNHGLVLIPSHPSRAAVKHRVEWPCQTGHFHTFQATSASCRPAVLNSVSVPRL